MPIMPTSITTAEELLRLHEPGNRHELVRGELHRMSPAGWWHGAVASRVDRLLGTFVDERSLGVVFGAETGFLLERDPDTVRAPDVAFVAAARVPREVSAGFFPGPPDLAVEVVSPGDSFTSVHEKALSWIEHGTRVVWVVDPNARRVTVYRGRHDVWPLAADDELVGGDVLPGFAIRVRELFPPVVGAPAS